MRCNAKGWLYAFSAWIGMALPIIALSQAPSGGDDGFGYAGNIEAYLGDVVAPQQTPGALEVTQGRGIEECGMIIAIPNYTAREISSMPSWLYPYPAYRKQALLNTQERCHDFVLNNHFHLRDALPLFNKAAAANNVQAVAHNLAYAMSIAKLPAQTATAKAKQVISSGDPYALFVLSDTLDAHGPFVATPGGEVGAPDSGYAWQLVACDHGLNCAAGSPVVNVACIGQGMCGPGDYRTNLQYTILNPARYEAVVRVEANINAALARGTVASLIHHR